MKPSPAATLWPSRATTTCTCSAAGALGAAYLAGLAVGYWQSAEDITRNWSVDRVFRPAISEEERTKRIKGWNTAVRCAYHWARNEEE